MTGLAHTWYTFWVTADTRLGKDTSGSSSDSSFQRDFATIQSTGCPEIQGAIAGRSAADFSPDILQEMAQFVRTSPPDTQAAPRKQR